MKIIPSRAKRHHLFRTLLHHHHHHHHHYQHHHHHHHYSSSSSSSSCCCCCCCYCFSGVSYEKKKTNGIKSRELCIYVCFGRGCRFIVRDCCRDRVSQLSRPTKEPAEYKPNKDSVKEIPSLF